MHSPCSQQELVKKDEFPAERGKRKISLFHFSVGFGAMIYCINIFVFSLAIVMHGNLNYSQSLHCSRKMQKLCN